MKNTAKYAWSFSRNSSFLRGLFYYAAPSRPIKFHRICMCVTVRHCDWLSGGSGHHSDLALKGYPTLRGISS